jgi:superoxide dismutase
MANKLIAILFGIIFEVEAYEHQYHYDYLNKRKKYAMWRRQGA